MATKLKTKDDQDTSTNEFLASAVKMLPAWADKFCPSWADAVSQKWPDFEASMRKEIARAQVGAERAPTPEIRAEMRAHVKALERLLKSPPVAPVEWMVSSTYLVGEVLMKKKAEPQYGEREVQGIIGQVDLTLFCRIPHLERLFAPGVVKVPNAYLPEELKSMYDGSWIKQIKEAEDGVWEVRPAEQGVELRQSELIFRFVLAPAPCNYQKVLKSIKLISPWLQLSGEARGHNDLVGVITNDRTLLEIVREQGDIAVFNEA